MERCVQELRGKIDHVIKSVRLRTIRKVGRKNLEIRHKRQRPDVKLRFQLARNLSAWSRANRVNAVADLPVTFSMSEVTAAQRFCLLLACSAINASTCHCGSPA